MVKQHCFFLYLRAIRCIPFEPSKNINVAIRVQEKKNAAFSTCGEGYENNHLSIYSHFRMTFIIQLFIFTLRPCLIITGLLGNSMVTEHPKKYENFIP